MESNKRRQILYRTHKNHKKVSLSVPCVNNSVSKQASNLTDEIYVHCAKVLWRNLKQRNRTIGYCTSWLSIVGNIQRLRHNNKQISCYASINVSIFNALIRSGHVQDNIRQITVTIKLRASLRLPNSPNFTDPRTREQWNKRSGRRLTNRKREWERR